MSAVTGQRREVSSSGGRRDIVVVGTSAGGIPALGRLLATVPPTLDAAVFIVLHMSPSAPSELARILQKSTKLPVRQARDGDSIERGTILVARPDHHLLLERNTVRTARGPRENRHRPAIDALFRSAAHTHATRVIAIVLTGMLDDGTAGLWTVRDRGGVAIVQDPDEADYPDMPLNALTNAGADHILGIGDMGALLGRLVKQTVEEPAQPVSKELDVEVHIAREESGLQESIMSLGKITPYTCPECHGVLLALKEGGVPRFRCHTGHAYSIDSLLAEVTEHVESTLWSALRSMEESAMLLNHVATHFGSLKGDRPVVEATKAKVKQTLQRAEWVRKAIRGHENLSVESLRDAETKSA